MTNSQLESKAVCN